MSVVSLRWLLVIFSKKTKIYLLLFFFEVVFMLSMKPIKPIKHVYLLSVAVWKRGEMDFR